jgi:hypothetical protein
MPLPKMDGFAIDFNMIPGYTPLWSAGFGQAPFNTPGTGGLVTIDTVQTPAEDERKPATMPRLARKATASDR